MYLIMGDVRKKRNMLRADFTTWAQKETQFLHREEKSIENWNCIEFHAWKQLVIFLTVCIVFIYAS